jgi:UDPglucose--hexose-1-phosphate uridylyltransferase
MPSWRYDELTETWVAVAAARRGLPVDPAVAARADPASATRPGARPCPFCPGAESETEPTVAALADAAGWRVRVVRNRFPHAAPDATPERPARAIDGREVPARGVHELVIEAREHALDWPDFAPAHGADVLGMYRDRYRALSRVPDVRHVSVFRNRGRRAGSSQSHPHAQLVATTVLPHGVAHRAAIARRHVAHAGVTPLAALVVRELDAAVRVVEITERFVVFCPFASHRAFETWIAPRAPDANDFGAVDDAELAALAEVLTRSTARIRAATTGADYNLIVRTPPRGDDAARGDAGWHLEILPRTGGDAGFELSTGIDVVPIAPEDAAHELRQSGPR